MSKQGADVPSLVQYVRCTTCNGSGWKKEKYSAVPFLITCPTCKGEKRLPLYTGDEDGKFMKKSEYNDQNKWAEILKRR